MGNNSSTCSTGNNSESNNLTDYDMTIYKDRKEKIFYGTIAICITYAVIAILLLIASYLSEKVRLILLTRFLPFTIIYIIGTIVIVLFLMHQVLNFKAIKIEKNNKYDENSCPDYWTLKTYKTDDIKNLFDANINNNYFKTRCVLNPNIYDTSVMKDKYNLNFDIIGKSNLHSNLNNENYYNNNILKKITGNENYNSNIYYDLIKSSFVMNNYKIKEDSSSSIIFEPHSNLNNPTINKTDISSYTYHTTGGIADTAITPIAFNKTDNTFRYYNNSGTTITSNIPFICDSVYPSYLASQDMLLSKNNSKLDQNVLRCAYSKICNVPWSEVNCDKYY